MEPGKRDIKNQKSNNTRLIKNNNIIRRKKNDSTKQGNSNSELAQSDNIK